MADSRIKQENAQLTRLPQFHNLELLTATYVTHTFPRHFHETFVIEVVESGVDEFYCKGDKHTAIAGKIVLFNPFEVHTGCSVGNQPLTYRSMYPAPELLLEVVSQLEGRDHALPFFSDNVICDIGLAKTFLRTHKTLEKGGDTLKLHSRLFDTLSAIIIRHADKNYRLRPIQDKNTAVKHAKEYLNKNYSENITLNRLAQVSGISPFYLLRAFHCTIGLPPYEYLVNLRVEQAKKLLVRDYSIAQVAYETGFYDQSHLNRHFKHIVGVTPGQYY